MDQARARMLRGATFPGPRRASCQANRARLAAIAVASHSATPPMRVNAKAPATAPANSPLHNSRCGSQPPRFCRKTSAASPWPSRTSAPVM